MRLSVPGHKDLRKSVVLNPQGVGGKSTLATNLAGYRAAHDNSVAIMDFDPQETKIVSYIFHLDHCLLYICHSSCR